MNVNQIFECKTNKATDAGNKIMASNVFTEMLNWKVTEIIEMS